MVTRLGSQVLFFGREEGAEAIFVDGLHVGFVRGDHALLECVPDGVVHELHSFVFAGDNDVLEFLGGALADDCAGGGVDDEDFVHGDASAAVGLFHEELCYDSAEGVGEHGAHLGLLIGGEDVDETVDGFAGVVGVEGAEDEEAGFCGGQRELDGFEVAHFADEDDVGVFAEGGFEADGEAFRVFGDFALGDGGAFVGVNELDGFLDGDDVPRVVGVNEIDECGEGGGFTGSGGTGDEHDPAAKFAELFHNGRDAELFEGQDFSGNDTEDAAESEGLLEEVATEAGCRVHFVREVEVAGFHEAVPAVLSADFAHHVGHFFVGEGFFADGDNFAVAPDFRGLTLSEVEVGAAGLNEDLEELVDVGHGERGLSVFEEAPEKGFLFAARVGFFGGDGAVFDEFEE